MYLFITGTGTDVGKSYVARGIVKELSKFSSTGYLKPFQSGIVENVLPDKDIVTSCINNVEGKSSYTTKTPSAPLISGEIDNVEFELSKVLKDYNHLKSQFENVIVEGSGGVYVPVKKGVLMVDVIKELKLPALIVARPDLGTINHTLMTIDCLVNNNVKIIGVVLSNFPKHTDDPAILRAKEMIEMFSSGVKVLELIKENQKDFSSLTSKIEEGIVMSSF